METETRDPSEKHSTERRRAADGIVSGRPNFNTMLEICGLGYSKIEGPMGAALEHNIDREKN